MKVSEMKHLCNFCLNSFPECKGKNIQFGIDVDPETAYTIDADKVIECDEFKEK